MIAAAKQVAEAVQATPGVLSAWADDWGQFGNFSLFVKIDASPEIDLRQLRRNLKEAVKRFAPGGELRTVIMPRRRYTPPGEGRRSFAGWDSDGIRYEGYGLVSVSLDFFKFSPATNSFPAIQPDGPFEFGAWGTPAYANGAPAPHIP